MIGESQNHRKSDPDPKISPPTLKMVTPRGKCPLHPLSHALQIFIDASRESRGTHLGNLVASGTWSLPDSKLHINYLELKVVCLAVKEFQDLCSNKIILIATDNNSGSKRQMSCNSSHYTCSAMLFRCLQMAEKTGALT